MDRNNTKKKKKKAWMIIKFALCAMGTLMLVAHSGILPML